jgi:hypothetical protein
MGIAHDTDRPLRVAKVARQVDAFVAEANEALAPDIFNVLVRRSPRNGTGIEFAESNFAVQFRRRRS